MKVENVGMTEMGKRVNPEEKPKKILTLPITIAPLATPKLELATPLVIDDDVCPVEHAAPGGCGGSKPV